MPENILQGKLLSHELSALGIMDYRMTQLQPASTIRWADNFNDDTMSANWNRYEVGPGSADEQNHQLEMQVVETGGETGFVSNIAWDLTDDYVMADLNLNILPDTVGVIGINLSLTKTLISSRYDEDDWVLLAKTYANLDIDVWYRVGGGAPSHALSQAYDTLDSEMKIKLHGDDVSFYENGELLLTIPWPLASKSCYIYLFSKGQQNYNGMGIGDDFELGEN